MSKHQSLYLFAIIFLLLMVASLEHDRAFLQRELDDLNNRVFKLEGRVY